MDVQYDDAADRARAAAVVFEAWRSAAPSLERVRPHRGLSPYVPGAFYERELPCLLPLVEELLRERGVGIVIVDGYVELGASPGLGRRLAERLAAVGLAPAVVGVAKTPFRGAAGGAREVLRGGSARPLFVTARGLDPEVAAAGVAAMHGEHRIPTLLRRVDHLARGRPDGRR